jgi:hypothetical protein
VSFSVVLSGGESATYQLSLGVDPTIRQLVRSGVADSIGVPPAAVALKRMDFSDGSSSTLPQQDDGERDDDGPPSFGDVTLGSRALARAVNVSVTLGLEVLVQYAADAPAMLGSIEQMVSSPVTLLDAFGPAINAIALSASMDPGPLLASLRSFPNASSVVSLLPAPPAPAPPPSPAIYIGVGIGLGIALLIAVVAAIVLMVRARRARHARDVRKVFFTARLDPADKQLVVTNAAYQPRKPSRIAHVIPAVRASARNILGRAASFRATPEAAPPSLSPPPSLAPLPSLPHNASPQDDEAAAPSSPSSSIRNPLALGMSRGIVSQRTFENTLLAGMRK